MAYKDKEKQREYVKNWIKKRRSGYFNNKSCVLCGSVTRLQLDHIDPEAKTDHRIWSWSRERRELELEKCRVLCSECHKEKTRKESSVANIGERNPSAKLTKQQVLEIRLRIQQGEKQRSLARIFGVGKSTISYIKLHERWSKALD